jgi:ISGsu1, transposase
MTNAKEHENHTLSEMPLSEGDTAVFDKGYCNYKNFGTFCEKSIFLLQD